GRAPSHECHPAQHDPIFRYKILIDPHACPGVLTRMRHVLFLASSLLFSLMAFPSSGQSLRAALPRDVTDHFFLTSDGVRLHYLEAGSAAAHTLVFVPGWTMPAWIWMPQILAFAQ